MIKFINRELGTDMWVSEDRADEYKAAGHIPAVDIMPDDSVSKESKPEGTESEDDKSEEAEPEKEEPIEEGSKKKAKK